MIPLYFSHAARVGRRQLLVGKYIGLNQFEHCLFQQSPDDQVDDLLLSAAGFKLHDVLPQEGEELESDFFANDLASEAFGPNHFTGCYVGDPQVQGYSCFGVFCRAALAGDDKSIRWFPYSPDTL